VQIANVVAKTLKQVYNTIQWDLLAKGFEATEIGFELFDPKWTFEKM